MRRFLIGTMMFGTLAIAPVMLTAQDHDGDRDHRDDHAAKVYYDRTHRDKHEWNDNESSNWDRYRTEHHIERAEFERASHRQQQNYWNWRHDHPDTH